MTRLAYLLAGLALALPTRADARIGAHDVTGASTLLLPYFEVALGGGSKATTLVSVVNTYGSSLLVRVNLWTDHGLPTASFFVYLTGYDMEVIDLRQLFVHGIAPHTASDGQDPADLISPKGGAHAQDINFGLCGPYLPPPRLSAEARAELVAAHTGQPSALFGGSCGGSSSDLAPNIARGFVTMDTVVRCSDTAPNTVAYLADDLWNGINSLIGFFEIRDDPNNFTFVDDLVHIESSLDDPLTDGAGDATFYGHLSGWSGVDHREAIGPRWRAKFELGGALGRTDVIVFRWPATIPIPFACDAPPAPMPLREVLVFDEQEQVVDATDAGLFPRVSQRVTLGGNAAIPWLFGMLDIDLREPEGATSGPVGDPTFRSGVVFAHTRAEGRFGIGMPAVALPVGGNP